MQGVILRRSRGFSSVRNCRVVSHTIERRGFGFWARSVINLVKIVIDRGKYNLVDMNSETLRGLA